MTNHTEENKDTQIPSYYIKYHQKISKYIEDSVSVAQEAKKKGLDISDKVDAEVMTYQTGCKIPKLIFPVD